MPSVVVAAAVVLLFVGSFLPATDNGFGFLGSALWTAFGPHLVILSAVALTVAAFASKRGRAPLFGRVTAVLAALGLVVSWSITAQLIGATTSGGGSVDPISALAVGSMTGTPADVVETYTSGDGQDLQAHVFQPTDGADLAPVFVYVHGGGWLAGDAEEGISADFQWLADRGWLVVSLDYRLATPGNPTWDRAPMDVACGLTWVADNASRLGGDADRLTVAGDSAGGNLSINLAYSAAQGTAVSGCGGTVPTPDAVVVQYPAVSPQAIYDDGYPVPGFEPRTLVSTYIGGEPAAHPDRMQAITSSTYISAQAPPTLILEPDADGLVPSASVRDFAFQALRSGVDVTTVTVPYANHIYDQLASGSLGNQLRLTVTENYLRSHGLAPAA